MSRKRTRLSDAQSSSRLQGEYTDEPSTESRGPLNDQAYRNPPLPTPGGTHGNPDANDPVGSSAQVGFWVHPRLAVERPDLYVVLRILSTLAHYGRMRPTHLERASQMNHAQFRGYRALLTDRGFLSVSQDNDGTLWVNLTETGERENALISGAVSCFEAGAAPPPRDDRRLACGGKLPHP
jgi:predicted transcriptional regulator